MKAIPDTICDQFSRISDPSGPLRKLGKFTVRDDVHEEVSVAEPEREGDNS